MSSFSPGRPYINNKFEILFITDLACACTKKLQHKEIWIIIFPNTRSSLISGLVDGSVSFLTSTDFTTKIKEQ